MPFLFIKILATAGFLLSLYAYYVERQTAKNTTYKALCDLSEKMSCTKAFSSRQGHLFGFSNALGGMLFYPLIFVVTVLGLLPAAQVLAIVSALGSLYMAYVSYIQMKNFCLVCTGIYLVNILLLLATRMS